MRGEARPSECGDQRRGQGYIPDTLDWARVEVDGMCVCAKERDGERGGEGWSARLWMEHFKYFAQPWARHPFPLTLICPPIERCSQPALVMSPIPGPGSRGHWPVT